MNIEIQNLPELSAEFEYHFGPVPGSWDADRRANRVDLFSDTGEWVVARGGKGLACLYRRHKPAPEPPAPATITLPICWDGAWPTVAAVAEKGGYSLFRKAMIGLRHFAHDREYRLWRFRSPDGSLSVAPADLCGKLCPEAIFSLVDEAD